MSATKTTQAPATPAAGFNAERLLTLLLAPIVSEKATQLADKYNQVIFRVRPDATKGEIKAAVELMWKDKKVRSRACRSSTCAARPGDSVPTRGAAATGKRPTSA